MESAVCLFLSNFWKMENAVCLWKCNTGNYFWQYIKLLLKNEKCCLNYFWKAGNYFWKNEKCCLFVKVQYRKLLLKSRKLLLKKWKVLLVCESAIQETTFCLWKCNAGNYFWKAGRYFWKNDLQETTFAKWKVLLVCAGNHFWKMRLALKWVFIYGGMCFFVQEIILLKRDVSFEMCFSE